MAQPNAKSWSRFCPVSGAEHEKFFSDYTFCGQCGGRNPDPAKPTEPFYRESTAIPRPSTEPASSAGPPSSPVRESSPAAALARYSSTTSQSSLAQSSFTSLGPREAERARTAASRAIKDQQARSNANSSSLSNRKSKSNWNEGGRVYKLLIEAYILPCTIRRGVRVYRDAVLQSKWLDGFYESEFSRKMPTMDSQRQSYLLSWCINRCAESHIQDLVDTYPTYYFVVQIEREPPLPVKVSLSSLAADSLDGMLAPFQSSKVGSSGSKQYQLRIVFKEPYESPESSPEPPREPKRRKKQAASRAASTPRQRPGAASRAASTPRQQPVAPASSVRTSSGRTVIKTEKADWSRRRIDPTKPPEHIDLSAASPTRESTPVRPSSPVTPTMEPLSPIASQPLSSIGEPPSSPSLPSPPSMPPPPEPNRQRGTQRGTQRIIPATDRELRRR